MNDGNESLDYRNLLDASSEEDLVLFQADLVTETSKNRKAIKDERAIPAPSSVFASLTSRIKQRLFTDALQTTSSDLEAPATTGSSAGAGVGVGTGTAAGSFIDLVPERENGSGGHVNLIRKIWNHGRNATGNPSHDTHASQGAKLSCPTSVSPCPCSPVRKVTNSNKFFPLPGSDDHDDFAQTQKHPSRIGLGLGQSTQEYILCKQERQKDNIGHEFDCSAINNTDDLVDGTPLSPGRDSLRWEGLVGEEDDDMSLSRSNIGYSASDADDQYVDLQDSERAPLVRSEISEGVYVKEGKPYSKRLLASVVLVAFICGAIGAGIALGVIYGSSNEEEPTDQVGYFYKDAAVAADSQHCSEIGRDTLLNGGGAIDAAIAGLLCVGLYNAHSAGVGGGSFILYYDRQSQSASFLDAREIAPAAATEDMYQNKSSDASTFGGLAIGVPGEIRGYWEAHQRFGKLPWADLFAASIKLAENGILVTKPLAGAIRSQQSKILADPSLSKIFTDGEGNILVEGDTVYRRELAQTLRMVAEGGADAFYTGPMAETIATEIQARGGIITTADLASYEVAVRTPISIDINDLTAYTGPPPCSGPVFSLMMNILEGYKFTPENLQSLNDEVLTHHRIIEAFKFGYAKRSGLGDGSFVNLTELVANMTSQAYADSLRARINDKRTYNYTYYDPSFEIMTDSGTSHISIVDQFGNAASITSTVNTYFGSKVRGETTGIIFNNEMDDFSKPGEPNFYGVPPSEANFIKPGKRPLSSMVPVILVDGAGDVRFVVGASGGTRITTAVSLVTIFNQWLGETLPDSIERRRVHHQLIPEYPTYEDGFSMDIVDGLRVKGHAPRLTSSGSVVQAILRLEDGLLNAEIIDGLRKKLHDPQESSSIAVVQAIRRHEDNLLEGYCDSRKAGRPAGF